MLLSARYRLPVEKEMLPGMIFFHTRETVKVVVYRRSTSPCSGSCGTTSGLISFESILTILLQDVLTQREVIHAELNQKDRERLDIVQYVYRQN